MMILVSSQDQIDKQKSPADVNADEPIVSSKLSILQTSISGAVAGMASRYICKRYAEVWLWNLADSDELNAN